MSTTPAIIQIVQSQGAKDLPTDDSLKQFDPSEHDVFDRAKRKKRKRTIPTGAFQKDNNGELLKINGEPVPVTKTVYEEVNRIAIPLQKLIVIRRAAFMNTGNMKTLAKPAKDLQIRLPEMVK